MAVQANAQNFTIDQLFGKWQFTANVEYTADATQAHKELLSGNCEATISKDDNYIAKIVGFAGSEVQQNINMIGAKNGQDMLKINNLNNPQLWNNLYLANDKGENPYGVWKNGEEVVKSYGPVYYNVYVADSLITIPDFTVVTLDGYTDENPIVIAKYTNVKMTLVEAETIVVNDISGGYLFKAGSGTYDTMAGSVIPTDFAINLVKKSDDNKQYDATIAIKGYADVTLPAAFNGASVILSYDNTYLDEANGIRFAPMYGSDKDGEIEFKATEKEGAFTLYGGFAFASDKLGKTKDESADSLYINGEMHQWYTSGTLQIPAETPELDWAGIYNVKVPSKNDVIIAGANVDAEAWPTEFQMEIKEVQTINGPGYAVASLFGYELPNGGWLITPSADGLGAEVKLDGYYGMAVIQSYGGGMYLVLTNSEAKATTLTLTINEDGSISIESCFIQTYDYNEKTYQPVVFYQNLTAEKAVVEEAPAFEWTGEYVLTSNVDNSEYPSTFDVIVKYNDSTPGYEYYYIDSFMGNSVYEMNYGGIALNIADDNNSAEVDMLYTNVYLLEEGKYLMMRDENASNSPIALTLNADQTITVADFTIVNSSTSMTVAKYSNVLLTKKNDTAIENVAAENAVVKGIFDMQGRKIENITAPGLYIIDGVKVLVK